MPLSYNCFVTNVSNSTVSFCSHRSCPLTISLTHKSNVSFSFINLINNKLCNFICISLITSVVGHFSYFIGYLYYFLFFLFLLCCACPSGIHHPLFLWITALHHHTCSLDGTVAPSALELTWLSLTSATSPQVPTVNGSDEPT